MSIRILPDEVASQIAAGEVVERPVSVVKELVENSIDAGARSIQISVIEAGRRTIEVADNGEGIAPSELTLAVARHATSKLREVADLHRIHSLGFRGEALASIGSVSRMTITSRSRDHNEGSQLVVEGGHIGNLRPVSAAQGTVIQVENLFFNVPARLKFLKSDTTEKKNIDAFVTRYAIAYPYLRFGFEQDGRMGLKTSGSGDQREILGLLYDASLARQMLEIDADYDGMRVRGYVSPTSETRGNRSAITFFVNGRWIRDNALNAALIQAYHGMLMVGRYPIVFLFIDLSPDQVDINVHPTKSEVRFQDPGALFSAVQRAVKRGLLAFTPVPQLSGPPRWTRPTGEWESGSAPNALQANSMAMDIEQGGSQPAATHRDPYAASLDTPMMSSFPLLRLIGQIGNAFLVAEGPDGLYLIDQHAAHERVLYERMMNERQDGIASQVLLEPAVIQLSPEEARMLDEQLPTLKSLGFEVEAFGPYLFRVRAVPAAVVGADPAQALRVVIGDFEEDETPLTSELEARLIARICKRAAVKAGQALRVEEQKALLQGLEGCRAPRTCPHGRPTMIHISLDLLERQFGRKGAI
ncbi:MAG: DNA mismatch repair endonuclease MutL [Chloroflexi bacterium]|nr:DNA mismatch repair endonuclease MutL [Chloroflexota bacterium]